MLVQCSKQSYQSVGFFFYESVSQSLISLFLSRAKRKREEKNVWRKNQILRIELRTSNVNPIERNVHVALYISLSFPIWFRSDCIHIALSYSLYQMVDREPLLVEIVITARVSKHKNIVQSIFIVAFWRIGNEIMIIKTISNIWTVWVGQFRNDSIDCHHLNAIFRCHGWKIGENVINQKFKSPYDIMIAVISQICPSQCNII